MTSIRACIQHALIFSTFQQPKAALPQAEPSTSRTEGRDFRFQLENGLPYFRRKKILYIIKYLNTTPHPEN